MKVYFINKATAIPNTFYCRDLSRVYSQYKPNYHTGPYDESEFNRKFASFPLNKDPYPLKETFASLDPHEMDKAVRVAFQLGSDIEEGGLSSGIESSTAPAMDSFQFG